MSFPSQNLIVKIQANDYAAVLSKSGEMFIWGPTPIG